MAIGPSGLRQECKRKTENRSRLHSQSLIERSPITEFSQEIASSSAVAALAKPTRLRAAGAKPDKLGEALEASYGVVERLRREFADRRHLFIETSNGVVPTFEQATLVKSEDGRHEYVFDASRVSIAALLEQASTQTQVLDVETHRAAIDDVIADIYESWQKKI